MTLNDEVAVIVRYPTEFGSHVKLCLALFLALSGIGFGLCLDLSCIMLFVTKLHKNLIHHESTIA